MITYMLADDIIKPRKSPFSTPVLLVKNKDGTLSFYLDYRSLNTITIKEIFLIPTVDELLVNSMAHPSSKKST